MLAHDLKLITDYQYKSLNIQYNKTFQGGEPGDVAPEVPTRLGNIVRHHLEVLGYSVTDSRDSCASGRRTFRGSTSRARGFRSSSRSYLVCVPLCQPHGSRREPTGASDQAARLGHYPPRERASTDPAAKIPISCAPIVPLTGGKGEGKGAIFLLSN